MDKLLDKLKTNAVITFILGILSLTWIFIDYFILKEILANEILSVSLETLLLIISGIASVIFHIWVFITLYYVMRTVMKHKSNVKKEAKEVKSL